MNLQLRRCALTEGLVFAAIPHGPVFYDLVGGALSAEADASYPTSRRSQSYNSGTAAPLPPIGGVQMDAASGGTSGQRFPLQATGLDQLNLVGTLLCLGTTTSGSGTFAMNFGSHEYVLNGYGVSLGIDNNGFAGSGRVLVQMLTAGAGSSPNIYNVTNNVLTSAPENKLHFFGFGWDTAANENHFYSAGLGLQRETQAGSQEAVLSQYRRTYIGRNDNGLFWVGGFTALALAWNRVLTLDEYIKLWKNPWAVFRAAGSKLFVVTPTGIVTVSSDGQILYSDPLIFGAAL